MLDLIEINWNPTRRTVRQFGWITLVASILIPAFFHLVKGLPIPWCVGLGACGVLVLILAYTAPTVVRWIYIVLSVATAPIGMTIGLLIFAAFYFLILTPVGLVFRLIGRDVLHRRWDPTIGSYWVPHRKTEKMDRYFRQF